MRGVAAPGGDAAGPRGPPRPRRPSPASRPSPRPRRALRAAPRALRPESRSGTFRDPHPGAEETAAAARLGSSAETWPRERRGGERRDDGLRPPGNSLCALFPFRKRERPLLASSRPGAGAAPAAGPGWSPLTTGPRRISESEFAAPSRLEAQLPDL